MEISYSSIDKRRFVHVTASIRSFRQRGLSGHFRSPRLTLSLISPSIEQDTADIIVSLIFQACQAIFQRARAKRKKYAKLVMLYQISTRKVGSVMGMRGKMRELQAR